MKKWISLFVSVALLSSCSILNKNKKVAELPGLASPIHLPTNYTRIPVSNYIVHPEEVVSISTSPYDKTNLSSAREVVFPAGTYEPVFNLNIETNSSEYDIPVFASAKKAYVFSYIPTYQKDVNSVFIAGGMNGWNKNATPLKRNEDGTYSVELFLEPGLYPYRIWENGTDELLDVNNKNKMPNGLGGENSFIEIPSAPKQTMEVLSQKGKKIIVYCTSEPKGAQVYFENQRIPVSIVHVQEPYLSEWELHFNIPAKAWKMKRSHIRAYAHDGNQLFNDVLIPLSYGRPVKRSLQLKRKDTRATVMYFAMVDRFKDGKKENNRPTNDPRIKPIANNLGGDLVGITQAIQDGYFKKLGTNTIWISPITKNAEGAWGLWDKGGDTSMFSGYHGYWPTSLRTIDDRFGTEEDFKNLLKVAHKHKMNVYLDYVAHHVHQDHPLIKEHKDWATPLYLPDGSMNTERWDDQRLTTWFDVFLPTWDFAKPEVISALTDTAMFWITNYDLDGFRHDATKHIRTEFWTTLTSKVKASGKNVFQIGETYGSPELIQSYIGSEQMDAQFDFNLYDAAVDAFAKSETSFANLGRVIQESAKYYGSHHMMGNITGNQDRARFISYADGSVKFEENAKQAGWSRKIEHKDNVGYVRLEQLTAFLMSVPGIPCIYYGDEIGIPGGNDPDNRRMMRFDQLNNEETALRTSTQKLVKLRRKNLPLIYGETYVFQADEKALVIARKYLDQISIAVFAKGEGNVNITLPGYWKGKVSTDGLEVVSTDAGSNSYTLKVGGKGYGFFFVK